MRLMIVGNLEGYISTAGKIALQRGARVIHCEDKEQALGALLNGKGADLAMVDIKQDIAGFVAALEKERIHMPVVACGIGTDARSAVTRRAARCSLQMRVSTCYWQIPNMQTQMKTSGL